GRSHRQHLLSHHTRAHPRFRTVAAVISALLLAGVLDPNLRRSGRSPTAGKPRPSKCGPGITSGGPVTRDTSPGFRLSRCYAGPGCRGSGVTPRNGDAAPAPYRACIVAPES